jgi:hypothetical protein
MKSASCSLSPPQVLPRPVLYRQIQSGLHTRRKRWTYFTTVLRGARAGVMAGSQDVETAGINWLVLVTGSESYVLEGM